MSQSTSNQKRRGEPYKRCKQSVCFVLVGLLIFLPSFDLPCISASYDKVSFVVMNSVSIPVLDVAQHYFKEHYVDRSSSSPSYDIKSALVFNYRPVFLQQTVQSSEYDYDEFELALFQAAYDASRQGGFWGYISFMRSDLMNHQNALLFGLVYAFMFGLLWGFLRGVLVMARVVMFFLLLGYLNDSVIQYASVLDDTATLYQNSMHHRESYTNKTGLFDPQRPRKPLIN